MGSLHSKTFYIDRHQVVWTIFWNAQGSDILSTTARHILDTAKTPNEVRTLELFRELTKSFIEEKPQELAYIATICAYAIKVRKKYNLSPWDLTDIIFTELNLPWTIAV